VDLWQSVCSRVIVQHVCCALQEGETYYAFIIHKCETERDFSLRLFEDLTARGYKCCHADLDFQSVFEVIANILTASIQSRWVIANVSQQFLESGWCMFEMKTALNLSYDHDRQIIIQVLYNINLALIRVQQ